MKLDNKELLLQRTKILDNIIELLSHLEVLKDNIDYIQSLKNMSGVFFRIKDIIYVLVNKNTNINSIACVMNIVDDIPSVLFKALDDRSIDYYKTIEGKINALDMFKAYIANNTHVILHELVHIDDKQNGIVKIDDKSVDVNPYIYYNHPSEIRAYTQECLYLAITEISDAIAKNEIKNKTDLKEFCKIYKKYKDIFTKAKQKNNFVYWKPITFKDYLSNLDYVINLIGLSLPE